MEPLLTPAFEYLSSHDSVKIRKGLRQIEGLLAQICLSRSQSTVASKERRRSTLVPITDTSKKDEFGADRSLADLSEDPAFIEFHKLQDGFEWNVAMQLVLTLERLLSRSSTGANDLLIVSALDLLQGILLLHPPSRTIFNREIYMNLLLDLLDPVSCPAIQSSTVLVLVTALLDMPKNTRCFERVDGLLAVTSVFKNSSTSRQVKMKLIEFFYFYLMPEAPREKSDSYSSVASSISQLAIGDKKERMARQDTRTSEVKQAQLGKYLGSVSALVEDLKDSEFGGAFN